MRRWLIKKILGTMRGEDICLAYDAIKLHGVKDPVEKIVIIDSLGADLATMRREAAKDLPAREAKMIQPAEAPWFGPWAFPKA